MLGIASYGRGGPHETGGRLTPAQLEQIQRTVRRTPEAVVKVLPRPSNELRAVGKHLDAVISSRITSYTIRFEVKSRFMEHGNTLTCSINLMGTVRTKTFAAPELIGSMNSSVGLIRRFRMRSKGVRV